MARTYTITVTDDETGVVIFAGRPTRQVLMILESDRAGRLVCDNCRATLADDLAGMDAEQSDGSGDEKSDDPDQRRECRWCSRWIELDGDYWTDGIGDGRICIPAAGRGQQSLHEPL